MNEVESRVLYESQVARYMFNDVTENNKIQRIFYYKQRNNGNVMVQNSNIQSVQELPKKTSMCKLWTFQSYTQRIQ